MKINAVNDITFFTTLKKDSALYQNVQTKQESSVQILISKEGQELYRKKIQETNKDTESYEKMREKRDKLLEAHLTASDVDYNFIFGEELGKYKQTGYYPTGKEQADNLLSTYATLYDKIVQGYADGVREIHVEDETSEKGYRILTEQEEISGLNASYKVYTDAFEEELRQEPQIRKNLEQYMTQLEHINQKRGSNITSILEGYADYLNKRQEETIPDHISFRLSNAASVFRDKYRDAGYGKQTLIKLLAGIKVF